MSSKKEEYFIPIVDFIGLTTGKPYLIIENEGTLTIELSKFEGRYIPSEYTSKKYCRIVKGKLVKYLYGN